MDLAVDEEAGGVGRARAVAADDGAGAVVEADEVAGGHEAEVLAEGVHPDVMGELGVTDGDVAGYAFGEAFAREVAEDGGGTRVVLVVWMRLGWVEKVELKSGSGTCPWIS